MIDIYVQLGKYSLLGKNLGSINKYSLKVLSLISRNIQIANVMFITNNT